MRLSKKSGILLAVSAAAIFSTSSMAQLLNSSTAATVNCYGVNSCKGQGSCNTPTSSCQGLNACKGKGVIKLSQADCLKRHGTIMGD